MDLDDTFFPPFFFGALPEDSLDVVAFATVTHFFVSFLFFGKGIAVARTLPSFLFICSCGCLAGQRVNVFVYLSPLLFLLPAVVQLAHLRSSFIITVNKTKMSFVSHVK